MFVKTERCHTHGMKYAIGLVQDLVQKHPDEHVNELLSLSALIAIGVKAGKLNKKKRRLLANLLRDGAFLVEAGDRADMSFWELFLGTKKRAKISADTIV